MAYKTGKLTALSRAGSVVRLLHLPIAVALLLACAPPIALAVGSAAAGAALACPFCLALMGSFPLNDLFDIERDRINKPYRPLPSGALSPRFALAAGVACEVAALALGLAVAPDALTLAAYLVAVAGASLYNVVLRFASPLKGFYTAAIIGIPLTYAALVAGVPLPGVFAVAAVAFFAGRELMMDVCDAAGDAATGLVTVAQLLGERRAAHLAWGLMAGAVALMGVSSAEAPLQVAGTLACTAAMLALARAYLRAAGSTGTAGAARVTAASAAEVPAVSPVDARRRYIILALAPFALAYILAFC